MIDLEERCVVLALSCSRCRARAGGDLPCKAKDWRCISLRQSRLHKHDNWGGPWHSFKVDGHPRRSENALHYRARCRFICIDCSFPPSTPERLITRLSGLVRSNEISLGKSCFLLTNLAFFTSGL